MKYAAPLFVSAAVALLSGCSSMKVKTHTIADYNFGTIGTYEWVQAPENILNEDDTYLNENVQIALNNELTSRDWKQVLETDQADIQIVYYIKLAEHQEYTATGSPDETRVTGGFTYNQNSGTWGANSPDPDLNVYTIEVGTLTLLIYNAETGEKIWKGTLQTRLDRTTPLNKQQKLLQKIARKIITGIPGK